MRQELQKKVDAAIKLLQSISNAYGGKEIEVAYSGGKDSDVILELTKMAGIPYRAIYKNTTIDPPGTIKHVKEMGAEIRQPKKTFFQLIRENGLPSRFSRFCCQYLKEYKIMDKSIMGIRSDESQARKKRYLEPTECRFYGSKKEHVEAIYPILNWSLEDVKEFVEERHLKLAPYYYREDGSIDYTRRLGCMGCPMAYIKNRREVFKQYPNLLRQYVRNLRMYRSDHPDVKVVKVYFNDEYEQMYRELFCITQEEFNNKRDGLFGRPDFKAFLEDYFKVKL